MNAAVIVAAGKGVRLGGEIPKQFLKLKDKPVLVHTLQQFNQLEDLFSETVVVLPAGNLDYAREKIFQPFFQPYGMETGSIKLVEGSDERQASVRRGLSALDPQVQNICIHDGVRPLVTPSLIKSVMQAGCLHGAATLAVPLKDTLKEVDGEGNVIKTLPRSRYRLIQTPQCFKRELIEEAHLKARELGSEATDDASLVELLGYSVKTVEGSGDNLKITTPEDLIMAEMLLEKRGRNV